METIVDFAVVHWHNKFTTRVVNLDSLPLSMNGISAFFAPSTTVSLVSCEISVVLAITAPDKIEE